MSALNDILQLRLMFKLIHPLEEFKPGIIKIHNMSQSESVGD